MTNVELQLVPTSSRMLAADHCVEVSSPAKKEKWSSWTTSKRYKQVIHGKGAESPIRKMCSTLLIREKQFKMWMMFLTQQIGKIFKSLRIPNGDQIWQNRNSCILLEGMSTGTQTSESKLAKANETHCRHPMAQWFHFEK